MSSEQTEITERYIQEIQWSDRATEHEKALVAGNIRQFAHGVMRPLLMVRETEKKMLRADLAALREQLAAEEAGRQADADAARAQREADLQELARMRCRARHAEKDLAAKDATIADQAAEIERLREVVAELEDNDAIGRRLTDGHLARIAELEAVVGKLPRTADGVPTYPGMPAWFAFRDGVHEAVLMMQSSGLRVEAYFPDGLEIFRDDDDEPYEVDYSRPAYSACYSTREAALAAAEAKP